MKITNVTFVSISDGLGGAEQVMLKMANYFLNKNIKVQIYFLKKQSNNLWSSEANSGNLQLYYFDGNVFRLLSALKKYNHQFIFSSHLMINSLLGFLRTLKLITTRHLVSRESTSVFLRYSGFKLWSYKLAYYIGYRKIDLLICQTEEMANVLLKNAPYLQKRLKIKKISNPFIYPNDSPLINIDGEYIVSAGRLINEKGFDVLIHSFKKLKVEYPNLKLIILGDGVLKPVLEDLINEEDLVNDVILQGHILNVYPFFRQAALCVVSSIREGFPNVLLQMMSQNNRVVSTLCAGDIDSIKGLVTVKPNDVENLYNGMSLVLNSESDKNRNLFDKELRSRSMNYFIESISTEINL